MVWPTGWSRRSDRVPAGGLSGGEQIGIAGQVVGGFGGLGLEGGITRPRQRIRRKPYDRFEEVGPATPGS